MRSKKRQSNSITEQRTAAAASGAKPARYSSDSTADPCALRPRSSRCARCRPSGTCCCCGAWRAEATAVLLLQPQHQQLPSRARRNECCGCNPTTWCAPCTKPWRKCKKSAAAAAAALSSLSLPAAAADKPTFRYSPKPTVVVVAVASSSSTPLHEQEREEDDTTTAGAVDDEKEGGDDTTTPSFPAVDPRLASYRGLEFAVLPELARLRACQRTAGIRNTVQLGRALRRPRADGSQPRAGNNNNDDAAVLAAVAIRTSRTARRFARAMGTADALVAAEQQEEERVAPPDATTTTTTMVAAVGAAAATTTSTFPTPLHSTMMLLPATEAVKVSATGR